MHEVRLHMFSSYVSVFIISERLPATTSYEIFMHPGSASNKSINTHRLPASKLFRVRAQIHANSKSFQLNVFIQQIIFPFSLCWKLAVGFHFQVPTIEDNIYASELLPSSSSPSSALAPLCNFIFNVPSLPTTLHHL